MRWPPLDARRCANILFTLTPPISSARPGMKPRWALVAATTAAMELAWEARNFQVLWLAHMEDAAAGAAVAVSQMLRRRTWCHLYHPWCGDCETCNGEVSAVIQGQCGEGVGGAGGVHLHRFPVPACGGLMGNDNGNGGAGGGDSGDSVADEGKGGSYIDRQSSKGLGWDRGARPRLCRSPVPARAMYWQQRTASRPGRPPMGSAS